MTRPARLVVRREELDDYDNQYVRKLSGPVKARFEEPGIEVEIGQVELWYIDGSRAADDGLDIVDVCDSLGQAEYEYASAVYSGGKVDISDSEGTFSNDVLIVHSLALQPECRDMEARIVREIVKAIGYHCALVAIDHEHTRISESDGLGLIPTKNPAILCLTAF